MIDVRAASASTAEWRTRLLSGASALAMSAAVAGFNAAISPVAVGVTAATVAVTAVTALPTPADAASAVCSITETTHSGTGNATASGSAAFACGPNASADGSDATAIGHSANASGSHATALGQAASADGSNATALGQSADASGSDATAVGQGAEASGSNATAIGQSAYAGGGSGTGATAVGQNAYASGTGDTAVGANSTVNSPYGTALGANTTVNKSGGVAIGIDSSGNGATSNLTNQFVMGTANHTYTAPGITSDLSRARQSGPLEVVTSDANGNLATDGGKIFEDLDTLEQGVAVALASVGPDLTGAEKFGVSLNWGGFEGANAIGGGITGVVYRGPRSRFALTGGIGVGLEEDSPVGGRAGGQWTWGYNR